MLTVGDCIDTLNKEKCYENHIKNNGFCSLLCKTKKLLKQKNSFCSRVVNFLLSFITVVRYEKVFYDKNALSTKCSKNILIPELKAIIERTILKTQDLESIDVWDINPYKSKKYIIFCAGISSEKSCINLQKSYLRLIKSGWAIIAFDYRGRGQSSGEFSQKGVYQDLCAVYKYLRSKNISDRDIGIIGHSMGSGVAADFACKSEIDMAFTILINPFYKASDMAKNIAMNLQMPQIIKNTIQKLPDCFIPLRNRFDNKNSLKKIKMPVLLIHCLNDETIPVSQARKLYKRSNRKNVRYIELKSCDHEINDEKIDICLNFIEELNV